MAIGGDAGGHRGTALGFGGSVLSSGHPEARHQPAQIPLPGPGMRLVEVVQVDHQILLGRRVETEVAEMRITTDDRGDAGGRKLRNVIRHDARGATKEAIGRGHHAADPDRDQPLHSPFVRTHDLFDRIRPVRGCRPVPHRAARHLLAQTPAELEPLGS